MTLTAASRDELVVEIAGIVCRLLIDRGAKVSLRRPELAVVASSLESSRAACWWPSLKRPHRRPRWSKSPKRPASRGREGRCRSSSPPVVVTRKSPRPAKQAVDELFDTFGLELPSQLVVTVEPAPPVPPTPDAQTPPRLKRWVM